LSFYPTSAVYSAHGLQVCCTLLPVMGFAWFQADRRHSPTSDPPPRRSYPSKLFAETVVLLSPGVLPPRRWSTVTEATAFPDLEDSFRPGVPPASALLQLRARAPLGFPRPRPSPEFLRHRRVPAWSLRPGVPGVVAPGFLSHTAAAVHGARRLPVPTLADRNRGARDGNRVSHGPSDLPLRGVAPSRTEVLLSSAFLFLGRGPPQFPGAFTDRAVVTAFSSEPEGWD
jgi:hypothetical protein